MVLDPLELGIVALMGIGVFIWGPEKVPEIARQIGQARKQLDVYTKELQGITNELTTSLNTGNLENLGNVIANVAGGAGAQEIAQVTAGSPANPVTAIEIAAPTPVPTAVPAVPAPSLETPPSIVKSGDQLLLEMARKLGISTQGKTRDDIQNEIIARATQPAEAQAPVSASQPMEASQPAVLPPDAAPPLSSPPTPTQTAD